MKERIGPRVDDVGKMVSDAPQQREALASLRTLIAQRIAQMDQALAAYRSGGQAAAIDAINTNTGQETMLNARSTIRALLAEESRQAADRRATESELAMRVRVETLLASTLVALALTAFFALTHRYLRQRDIALSDLKSSNAELEQRVVERTVELSNLSRHLLNIRENEKKNIARELHDEFGSYLTAINMDVSRMRDKVGDSNPEQAARLDRTLKLLSEAITVKRRLMSDLRPSILDNLGLGAALEQYIDEWSGRSGIVATFDYRGTFDDLEEGCPIAIFRVFQEALNNIATHSQATAVYAHARLVGDGVDVEISDNGIGLTEEAKHKPDAHGLLGIRERVLAYRGHLDIRRGPAGGTVIHATFPCNMKDSSESAAADKVAVS